MFLLLAGTQSVSASIFTSINSAIVNGKLGFEISKTHENSMYLGQWKDQISNKLNPSYYNRLVELRLTRKFSNNLLNTSYDQNFTHSTQQFIAPVFKDNFFSLATEGEVYFSFASESIKFSPALAKQAFSNFNSSSLAKNSQSTILEQEYYTPGYVVSTGNSSFGLAAILVQQSFLDDKLGSVTFASNSNNLIFFDEIQRKTTRGTGYQFNFTQKLGKGIDVSIDYQSQVNMNEFDSFGQSYSDGGDFDIPSQYTVSVGMPILGSRVNFSAERIDYSNVETTIHSGYPQSFLDVTTNGIFSPLFELKDLTVYSASFEKNINNDLSWNMKVVSRQQAAATAAILNNILINDTASVSYKLGLSYTAKMGQLNLFASFANKPLLIGGTEFGRLSGRSLDSHIEGVASWSFQF